jgi:glycosyltransferase involved in cell wall biosynthesis
VLTGKMSYHANVTAAYHLINDIMPLVWAADPSVQVRLVGSTPPPNVRALAERNGPRVTVTGHVPDMRPHLQAATMAVAPMAYGAGIQNKVLEAMACGTPVIASPPAVAALPESAKEAVLIAADAPSTAAAILALLRDPLLRNSLGQRGRAYVCEHFDWSQVAAELELIYDGLID